MNMKSVVFAPLYSKTRRQRLHYSRLFVAPSSNVARRPRTVVEDAPGFEPGPFIYQPTAPRVLVPGLAAFVMLAAIIALLSVFAPRIMEGLQALAILSN